VKTWHYLLIGVALWWVWRRSQEPKVTVGRIESNVTSGPTSGDIIGEAMRRITATDDDVTQRMKEMANASSERIGTCDRESKVPICTTIPSGWKLPEWYLRNILGLK
jgi:hypothetical protein